MGLLCLYCVLCSFKNERWKHKWCKQHGRIRVSSAHPLLKTSIWTTIHVQKYLDKTWIPGKGLREKPRNKRRYIGEDRKDNFILTTCSWFFAWTETISLWRESKVSNKASTELSECQVTLCGLRLQVCSHKSRDGPHLHQVRLQALDWTNIMPCWPLKTL